MKYSTQVVFYFLVAVFSLPSGVYSAAQITGKITAKQAAGYSAARDAFPEVSDQEFARLSEQADQGDSKAQCRLGKLYLYGWGTKADPETAWQLFQQAAAGGSAEAMNKIGGMYEQGIDVEKNYTRALQWHLRSATLGNADGQSDAGRIYEDGLAGERDTNKALYWYRKAAAQGEPFALEAVQRLKAHKGESLNPPPAASK